MALAAAAAAATEGRADVTRLLLSSDTGEGTARAEPESLHASWIPPHWTEIDRLSREDDEAIAARIQDQKPFVMSKASIIPLSGWEDLDVLTRTMSRTKVLVKRSRRDTVAYFRAERNEGRHPFHPDEYVRESKVPFSEFIAEANVTRDRRGAQGSCADQKGKEVAEGDVLYCQETFMNHPELQDEFSAWDWTWVLRQCKRHGWGLPETNVLFMGTEGATTPAHFDEQHNFLQQVRGEKLVVLFPPDDYTRMYPFPVTHPCDRCSLVDVRTPDLERFPNFREVRGQVTTLVPGDVLYIPYAWWHYCRTETHLAASITFWAQATSDGKVLVPAEMGPNEWTRARRNLEKLLAQEVGPDHLDAEVLRLLSIVERGNDADDARLKGLLNMIGMLQVPEKERLAFLTETFRGRFGFNHSLYV